MTSIRILPRNLSRFPPIRSTTRAFTTSLRLQDAEIPPYLDDREKSIFTKLQSHFSPTKLEVQDVSGGCGSMYAVEIASEKFKGLPLLKQHRLVKDALGEDVKKWHGFQLRTKVPE